MELRVDAHRRTAGYRREGLLGSHQEIGGIRRDMLLFAAVRCSPGIHSGRDSL